MARAGAWRSKVLISPSPVVIFWEKSNLEFHKRLLVELPAPTHDDPLSVLRVLRKPKKDKPKDEQQQIGLHVGTDADGYPTYVDPSDGVPVTDYRY